MSWGRFAAISARGCPPKVILPRTPLYSYHMEEIVFRNVVHPLPGFPITRSISPCSMVPENPLRIGRDGCPPKRFWMGLRTPKPDFATDAILGAAWDFATCQYIPSCLLHRLRVVHTPVPLPSTETLSNTMFVPCWLDAFRTSKNFRTISEIASPAALCDELSDEALLSTNCCFCADLPDGVGVAFSAVTWDTKSGATMFSWWSDIVTSFVLNSRNQ